MGGSGRPLDFIDKNINNFVKTGDYYYLGKALHTLQDSFCPGHEGFQTFYSPGENVVSLILYVPMGLFHTVLDQGKDRSPKAYKEAKKASRELLMKAFRLRQEYKRRLRREENRNSSQIYYNLNSQSNN